MLTAGIKFPVAGQFSLKSCGLPGVVILVSTPKSTGQMKYLAHVFCLAFWHACDISIVTWHLNNIIHQEHGIAQFSCKISLAARQTRAFSDFVLDGVMKCRGVIESRCWASSCFCCESVQTWQANRSRSLGASVYCVGVKDFNETQVCFFFKLCFGF